MRLARILFVFAAACRIEEPASPEAEVEAVLKLPGAQISAFELGSDGSILFAVGQRVFKVDSAAPDSVTEIGTHSGHIIKILATASATFVQSSQDVARLRRVGDNYEMDAQIPWLLRSDPVRSLLLLDCWAGSDSSVYVVGDWGRVLRFNGYNWNREINPAESLASLPIPAAYASSLWAVGGYGNDVAASTHSLIMRRDRGVWQDSWDILPDSSCRIRALTLGGNDSIYVAGGEAPCLYLGVNRVWSKLEVPARLSISPIDRGARQRSGSHIFWNKKGDVIVVHGNRVALLHLRKFRVLRGVFEHGSFVYAAGLTSTGSEIIRVRADPKEGL